MGQCFSGASKNTQTLRTEAQEQFDLRAMEKDKAANAYQKGDHEAVKYHKARAANHEAKAKAIIEQVNTIEFELHNKGRPDDEIDLHGLYVDFAVEKVKERLELCKTKGLSPLQVITGKGLHSEGGVAKIKPAMWGFIKEKGYVAETDPKNPGVLLIKVDPSKQKSRCVIM